LIDIEQKKEREELKHFLNRNAFHDPDGSKFMKHLEDSKFRFGPFALKVAEDYINRERYEQQKARTHGKRGVQEKISFVMMEYFLRGVVEADRLIDQLKHMEIRINLLMDEQDALEQKLSDFKTQQDKSATMRQPNLKTTQFDLQSRLGMKQQEVEDCRYQISMRETELLIVFRELESCNFHVPDHIFER